MYSIRTLPLIFFVLGLVLQAGATTTAANDLVSLCSGTAVVDVLANDSNDTGRPFAVSLGASTCTGSVSHLGHGIFDVTGTLGSASSCSFQYLLFDGSSSIPSTVSLSRESGCTVVSNDLPLLKIHSQNSRYLADQDDNVVYLAGGHVWQNLQDYGPGNPPPTNCGGHECGAEEWVHLSSRGHNFTRGWHWEQGEQYGYAPDWHTAPIPFIKVNGKYNLDCTKGECFNEAYFTRLRERVQGAADAGLYISVMLFEGFSPRKPNGGNANSWEGHPFHPSNTDTFDSYNSDLDGDGGGEEIHSLLVDKSITDVQRAYVKRVVEELNGFDNIIWEICNECGDSDSTPSLQQTVDWMDAMAAYIRNIEGTGDYPKEHLIWISSPFGHANGQNDALESSTADLISVRGDKSCGQGQVPCFHVDPPANNYSRPVLLDSDHIYNPYCIFIDRPSPQSDLLPWCGPEWPWKVFLRGYNPVFMDTLRTEPPFGPDHPIGRPQEPNDGTVEGTRHALGQTVDFVRETIQDLAAMTPRGDLTSTNYALASPGNEYLVFQPDSSAQFSVQLVAGTYDYQWFDIHGNGGTGMVEGVGTVIADGGDEFFDPGGEDYVLYLVRSDAPPDLVVTEPLDTAAPVGGQAQFFVSVSGGTPPYAYQWQGALSPGGPFADLNHPSYSGVNSATLTVDPVEADHDGLLYRCVVTEAGGESVASALATLTVEGGNNNPPVAVDDYLTTAQDTQLSISLGMLLGNDSDPDGDSLTLINYDTTTAQGGSNDTGHIGGFNYTPPPGFVGTDSFSYTVSDGNGGTDTATVFVEVTNGNNPPVAVDDYVTTAQDTPLWIPPDMLLGNDSDPDGDDLTIIGYGMITAQGGSNDAGYIDGFNYTPPPGFVGTDSFGYTVSDGNGGTDTATVFVEITSGGPVAHDDGPYTTVHGTAVGIAFSSLLENDEGAGLTVEDFPVQPQRGALSVNGSSVDYQPEAGFSGTDEFQYRLRDGSGNLSEPAIVTVRVRPEAVYDVFHECGGSVTIFHNQLLANDNGSSLAFDAIVDPPLNGTLDTSRRGRVIWHPPAFSGRVDAADRFSYRVRDAGGLRSDPAYIDIKTLCFDDEGGRK